MCKEVDNYWESDNTPTPLFATTTIAGCCLKYSSTPDNVRYEWPKIN